MAKINYDGVVETAHFKPDGQLDWVRVYLRMDSVFTDRIILSRQAFIDQLKKGKRFWVGQRILNMGGMFNVSQPVRLVKQDGMDVAMVGEGYATRGELSGVPVI